MSYTFTKLFSSITSSTVWMEPSGTRLTWIAMLANADRKGRVFASLPGLAHLSRVTLEEAEKAIQTFLAPDPYSRTPDNEGRRIEAIEGGWQLLNYAHYRSIRDEESIAESKREYMRRKRAEEKSGKSGKSDSTTDTMDRGGSKQKQKQKQKQVKQTPCSPPAGDDSEHGDVPKVKHTFARFLESLGEKEKAIKPADPIFEYAKNAGIPSSFLALAWHVFRQYHLDRPDKKQLDWRAVFRNYVRENYLKLWRPVVDGYELTEKGEQAARAMKAEGKS